MRHPLHPALVHFPIACWSMAVVADVASLWMGEPAWRFAAGLLLVGCAMAVPAIVAGLLEFSRVPEGPPLRDAYRHMGLMVLAGTLFTARLLLGLDQCQPRAPGGILLSMDLVGIACLTMGGWLGGRLVYRHGIGTDFVTSDQRKDQ